MIYKYAFAVVEEPGNEVVTWSGRITSDAEEDIVHEVVSAMGVDEAFITDLVVITSKSKIAFDQIELSTSYRSDEEE